MFDTSFGFLYREIFIIYFPIYSIVIDRETIVEVIKDYQEMDLPDLIKRDIDIPLDLKIKRGCFVNWSEKSWKNLYNVSVDENFIELSHS